MILELSVAVAMALGLPSIEPPKVVNDCAKVEGKSKNYNYAVYMRKEQVIYTCDDIPEHVLYHEIVHHYQNVYKMDMNKREREKHAQELTREWMDENY